MQMNPTIERFYLDVLDYGGLRYNKEENIIETIDDRLSDITVDDEPLTLPYQENLKNPEGKTILHPLNEDYINPNNATLKVFLKALTFGINFRLSNLLTSIIHVGCEPALQKKIKDEELMNIITSIGESETSYLDTFVMLSKAGMAEDNVEYLVGLHVKKKGKIKDKGYAAIGKLNFNMYEELLASMDDKGKYAPYGKKIRKKDYVYFTNLFKAVIPFIDDEDQCLEGTNNNIFRYFGAWLKTSYLLTSRIQELEKMLLKIGTESLGCLDEEPINLDWVDSMQELMDMSNEIRMIPQQTDLIAEAKRMRLDESKAQEAQQSQQQPQTINQHMIPQQQSGYAGIPAPQPIQQQQQPEQMSALDVLRAQSMGGYTPPQPMQQAPMMGMGMMQQPTNIPRWMQEEEMRRQYEARQAQQQQQMMQQMPQQQPMYQGYGQPMMQQPMQYGFQGQQGYNMPMPYGPRYGRQS